MVLWMPVGFGVFHNTTVEHCDLLGCIHTGEELCELSTRDADERRADSTHPTRQMWPKPKGTETHSWHLSGRAEGGYTLIHSYLEQVLRTVPVLVQGRVMKMYKGPVVDS